jgi:hypothetical protein
MWLWFNIRPCRNAQISEHCGLSEARSSLRTSIEQIDGRLCTVGAYDINADACSCGKFNRANPIDEPTMRYPVHAGVDQRTTVRSVALRATASVFPP